MSRRLRRAISCGLCIATCAAVSVAAQNDPPKLVVPGAVDGELKLLAETAHVSTALLIESISAEPVTVVVGVGPFRDTGGRLHPATAAVDIQTAVDEPAAANSSAASPATPTSSMSTSLPIELPAHGVTRLRIEATLEAVGDYTTDIVLTSLGSRDVFHLTVTRALRDLSVDIQGVDAVHGTTRLFSSNTGELRLVLLERSGRKIALDAPQLTKLTRKAPGSGRMQAAYRLTVDGGEPQPVTLAPNQSRPLTLTLSDLAGAGEYTGTIRISAPGAKPVDQDFTVTLRDSRWLAFGVIVLGVVLSAFLRWISRSLRPRLVETRRAHLLARELDELLAEPSLDSQERDVLQLLRREVIAARLALDVGSFEGVKTSLDRLDDRRRLAVVWMRRRRQVEALRPEALRDRFRPKVDAARDVIVDEESTAVRIAEARKALVDLKSEIDAALREELTAQITRLRQSLDAAVKSRPSSQLAIVAPAALGLLLDEAEEAATAGNLRVALSVYDRAQREWTSFLLDDLAAIVAGVAPQGLSNAEWTVLSQRLETALSEARVRLADDPEGAIRRYHAAWADYVATVSGGLSREFDSLRQSIQADQELDEDARKNALALVDQGAHANAKARADLAIGGTQEAVGSLSTALEALAAAKRAMPRTRSGALHAGAASNVPSAVDSTPPVIPGPADDFIGTEKALAVTTAALDRIDLFVVLVAVVVATLLGLTMLWTPNPTWGGWDDWIVAILWGLGFHQVAFTGLAGVTDRLRGGPPSGGQP